MSAADTPVRWGVLSTAHINLKFLAGARQADGAQVAAVASRELARAQAYAAEHDIPRAYGSYEELLDDPEIEAVYIPLPNALHVPWAMRALEAGKHVLCEKPLARRAADAQRAYALAAERGRRLSEAFMYAHHPQMARVRELIAEGAIGPLHAIRAQFSFPIARADDVRMLSELDGGALMDVGCYCVHAARQLAGEPEQVAAVQVIGGDGVDIRFAGAMRMATGVLAHFDCGFDLARRSELEVIGHAGALTLRDPWHAARPAIERRTADGEVADLIELPVVDSYRLQAESFSAAVRGRGPLLLGAQDGVAQARAIESLYRAAETPAGLQ